MIEVFDTTAARIALTRRMLGCPGCDQPLRLWGHARERTIRDTGGTPLTIRPDRALCTSCGATHVVLDAGLLPRRGYAVGLIGQALVAAARGHGHRPIARDLTVPASTVRGWIRGARRSAVQLRVTGIRAVLASGQDHLLAWARTDELGAALEHLAAAALVLGRRHGLEHTCWRARINVLTRGRLLTMAPAGLSRPRRSRPAPARRQQSPPKICLESGTSPMWTGTFPTTPPEMPGSSSAS